MKKGTYGGPNSALNQALWIICNLALIKGSSFFNI